MADFIRMTALSPTMEEGTIQAWNIKPGDRINSGDVICEIETDKANMEYEAVDEGSLLEILISEGEKASVGDPIAIFGEPGEDTWNLKKQLKNPRTPLPALNKNSAPGEPAKLPEVPEKKEDKRVKISPLAKKIAKARGLNLSYIQGTGPGGRIIKRDVEAAASKAPETAVPGKTIPVSSKRAIIARRLSESKFSAPHYYLKIKANAGLLLKSREQINKKRKKISFNAFLMKLTAEALKKHPVVHSSWQGDSILRFASIDIALAIALEDSLITPVIRNCGEKGIVQIENELSSLIAAARESRLTPDQITGATFTISNIGSYGIDEFTAIINPPGSAILAVGKITREPIFDENENVVPANIMRLTLSCDHRVIDGAAGAAFLADLKGNIENPFNALL